MHSKNFIPPILGAVAVNAAVFVYGFLTLEGWEMLIIFYPGLAAIEKLNPELVGRAGVITVGILLSVAFYAIFGAILGYVGQILYTQAQRAIKN